MSALERLREDMAQAVRAWQCTPAGGGLVEAAAVIAVLTENWRVEMKLSPSTRERHYVITTPKRPANALEKLADEARAARDEWLYRCDDEDVPPPASVSTMDLLGQRVWWIDGLKRAVRLDDMEPSHRLNLLAFLKRNAERYQWAEWTSGVFDNAPDEVADAAVAEDALRWLGRQELVRRLKKLVRQDRRRAARTTGS